MTLGGTLHLYSIRITYSMDDQTQGAPRAQSAKHMILYQVMSIVFINDIDSDTDTERYLLNIKKKNRNQKYTQYMQTVHDTRHIIRGTPYTIHVAGDICVNNNSNNNNAIVLRSKTETEKTCKIYTPNQ